MSNEVRIRNPSLWWWDAARWKLIVRFGDCLIILKLLADSSNHCLLYRKRSAYLLYMIRDTNSLISNKLCLKILLVIPFHFPSLKVIILDLEIVNTLEQLVLLRV